MLWSYGAENLPFVRVWNKDNWRHAPSGNSHSQACIFEISLVTLILFYRKEWKIHVQGEGKAYTGEVAVEIRKRNGTGGVAFLSLVTERTETPVQGLSGNAPLLWAKPVLLDYSRVMGGTLSSSYPLAELFELPEKRLSRKQGKARENSVVRKLAKPGNKGAEGGCLSLAGSFRLLTGRTHGDSGSSCGEWFRKQALPRVSNPLKGRSRTEKSGWHRKNKVPIPRSIVFPAG